MHGVSLAALLILLVTSSVIANTEILVLKLQDLTSYPALPLLVSDVTKSKSVLDALPLKHANTD